MTTTVVVGTSIVTVQASSGGSDRAIEVTVTLDEGREWTFDQPAWRPLSLGVGCGVPYLWLARAIIAIPEEPTGEPEVVEVDEDLVLVFRVGAGWLAVCETSVRLISNGTELDRIELGDTVETARWQHGRLIVRESRGHVTTVALVAGRLVA